MHRWDPEDYQKSSSAQFEWAMALISRLKLYGRERILDIGCGDGRVTARLAALVSEGSVLGVDLSAEMVGYAAAENAMHPNLRFEVADASQLDFTEEFDLVVSFACLHWIRDHLPVLRGVRDSLVPGGHFLMQCGGRGNAAGLLSDYNRTTYLYNSICMICPKLKRIDLSKYQHETSPRLLRYDS